MKVLIADDDRAIGLALQMAIEDLGHECLVAEDGRAAWQLYQEGGADTIISDWRMPGLQGPELCRLVRADEARPYVYFVLLTVLDDPGRVLEGMQAGADDYLTKPFTIDQLRARLIAAERVSALHHDLRQRHADSARAAEERGRLLRQLEREHSRLESVIRQMPAGILIVAAPSGHVVMVNEQVGEIWQIDAARVQTVWDLAETARRGDGTPIDPHHWALARSITAPGEAVAGEEILIERPDGTLGTVRVSSAPLFDSDRLEAAVVIMHDLTEERRRQQEAAQSEKLRALGQLAGGVAHDLNQYLTLVAGYADIGLAVLRDNDAPAAELREILRIMSQAAYDGGETVKRLLTFGRNEPDGNAETISVGALLQDVARLTTPRWRDAAQAQGRPIRLTVDATSDLFIEGWPPALREALTNLVFNSIDALPAGGEIALRARRMADRIVIEVADSGVGMSPEVQRRMFEPFYTTKGAQGTGLGLPMVFGIVTRQRGEIHVQSAPGQGTTVQLNFPGARDAAAAAVQANPTSAVVVRHILVVDDEDSIRHMVARVLAYDGHTVSTVGSGEDALERLGGAPFDIMITDIGLGAGMNGWELIDRARRLHPAVCLIVASGWGAEIEPEVARERGAIGVLSKPYRFTELRRLIAQCGP